MRSHPSLFTLRILWFALLVAAFLYMGIAYGVLAKNGMVPQNPIMPPVLGGLSCVIAVISFLLPRITYQQAAKSLKVDVTEEVAPSAFPDGYRDAMPKRQVFADPEAATKTAFACFMSPFILSIALSESIALFGLVLAQLGFETVISLPFFLAGAVLIAVRFPRQATVLGMFERAKGASFPARTN